VDAGCDRWALRSQLKSVHSYLDAAGFTDWERWCADMFDSHSAYPMLLLFRSRQPVPDR
jgi:hypothetical protein